MFYQSFTELLKEKLDNSEQTQDLQDSTIYDVDGQYHFFSIGAGQYSDHCLDIARYPDQIVNLFLSKVEEIQSRLISTYQGYTSLTSIIERPEDQTSYSRYLYPLTEKLNIYEFSYLLNLQCNLELLLNQFYHIVAEHTNDKDKLMKYNPFNLLGTFVDSLDKPVIENGKAKSVKVSSKLINGSSINYPYLLEFSTISNNFPKQSRSKKVLEYHSVMATRELTAEFLDNLRKDLRTQKKVLKEQHRAISEQLNSTMNNLEAVQNIFDNDDSTLDLYLPKKEKIVAKTNG